MVRYRLKKAPRQKTSRGYKQRDIYHILNRYKLPGLYNQNRYKSKTNPYKGRAGTRRGYRSGLYNPSQRTRNYVPSSKPKYQPVPKQSLPRGNPRPWTEPRPYKIPRIRTEPDIEQMIKQLENRFDKKLEEQVLERLEAEFEKLQETLAKERAEREELEEMRSKQIEAFFQQHGDELTERFLLGDLDNPEPTEIIEADGDTKKIEPDMPKDVEHVEKVELDKEPEEIEKDGDELTNEIELYEINDELREQTETDLPEMIEENEGMEEPIQEPIETELTDQRPIEHPIEADELLPTSIEEPIVLDPEQLADLEPLLDQIELLEPIEQVEVLPELFPEAQEPEVIDGEAY